MNVKEEMSLHKKAVGIIVAMLLAFLLMNLIGFTANSIDKFRQDRAYSQEVDYFTNNDGNFFLNVVSVEPSDAEFSLNENAEIRFCREPKARITATENFRVFYKLVGANFKDVLTRKLPDGINYEGEADCTFIQLRPEQRPNDPGTYRFCQEFDFIIKDSRQNEYLKDASFCSGDYVLI